MCVYRVKWNEAIIFFNMVHSRALQVFSMKRFSNILRIKKKTFFFLTFIRYKYFIIVLE